MATYIYRHPVTPEDMHRLAVYDVLYQDAGSDGVGWQPGMWFPNMAREEGYPQYKAGALCHEIDHWMAHFMMTNLARWERRDVE